MTMNELADKLNEWTDYYSWSNESLNDFANTYATSYVGCGILVSSKERSKHMMVAIIILAALLSFQFVSAIKRDCLGLGLMFGVEIILFAYIAKNFI